MEAAGLANARRNPVSIGSRPMSLAGRIALVAGATRGAGRGIAVELGGSRPDAWRYMEEVHDAGKPADVTGYR
jgi:hypothetical protein